MIEKEGTSSERATRERNFAQARVAASVACRRCTYNLRGLSLEGRCPECGLEVLTTIHAMVDPAASNLPRLRDPSGVGNGLFWLLLAMLSAATLLMLHAALTRIPGAPLPPIRLGPLYAHDLVMLAAIFVFSGLWSVLRFRSPRSVEKEVPIKRNVRLLGISLVALGIMLALLWHRERVWAMLSIDPMAEDVLISRSWYHIALAAASIIVLRCVDGIFHVIGRRSREYRRARGGRQGIGPMTAAVVGVAIGTVLRAAGTAWPALDLLRVFGSVIVWICSFMLLIGLVYLAVNGWWIRRALRRPPPLIEELIAIPDERQAMRVRGDEPPSTEYFR